MTLLVVNAFVRGMGAGIIYDAALVSAPLRKRIGVVAYAHYLRANLSGPGVKSYVTVAWTGLLLTLTVTIAAFMTDQPALVSWCAATSLLSTVVAFLGTGLALPTLFRVVRNADQPALLTPPLNRYARWYGFSAI